MATTALVSAAELEQMADGERFELIRGALREVAPPGGDHAWLQIEIGSELRQFVKQHCLGRVYGEVGFVIARDPDTVRAPDVAFVRADRLLPRDKQSGFLHQVPDLAVEIVSPGDRASEVLEKVMMYLEAGVPAVWTVDPKRLRVMVWDANHPVREFGPGQTLDGGDILPGFQLPVADIFDDITGDPASG